MTVTVTKHITGVATKVSTKTGEPYQLISFMDDDGMPVSVMLHKAKKITEVKQFGKYELDIDIKMGKYMSATVLDLREVI